LPFWLLFLATSVVPTYLIKSQDCTGSHQAYLKSAMNPKSMCSCW
jgi:hypothetical protein